MNIENLRNTHPEMLSKMKEAGYSDDYVGRIRKEIMWILTESEMHNWQSYGDIYHYYEKLLNKCEALGKKHAILGAIERFDYHGKIPNNKWTNLNHKSRGAYPKLNIEFRKLLDYYTASALERGKKESTIYMEANNAANFLLALQEKGFESLSNITEDAVLSIFVSPEGLRLKGHTFRKSVTAALNACAPIAPIACKRVSSFLPKTRSTRKNIQYLTIEESKKIREALDNKDSNLTLRDRAIGKLALYMGLRGSDIAALELSSVNWESDTITVIQQKTGKTIELPLTAVVGNAIYDYLNNERPYVDNAAMFLVINGSIRGISSDNMRYVSEKIMKAAGIRQTEGDRKGLHIFRHHVATTLLGNDVNTSVISHALGHSSPRSVETYLSADFIHIKSCSLSISQFPMKKGVLKIG